MDKDTHIDNLVENAINKIGTMLDEILPALHNEEIRWNNLDIKNESDFLKGYLVASVLLESMGQFYKFYNPNPPEALEVIMNRAGDIKKVITDEL